MGIAKVLLDLLREAMPIAPSTAMDRGARFESLTIPQSMDTLMHAARKGHVPGYGKSPTNSEGMPIHLLPAQKSAARNKLDNPPPPTTYPTLAEMFEALPEPEALPGAFDHTPGVRAAAVEKAEDVLKMLREGRADELGDHDLAPKFSDPVGDTAFNEHLFLNYDLPMDAESRAARAEMMDFGETMYRGSKGNSSAPRTPMIFASDDPAVAHGYATNGGTPSDYSWEQRFSVAPLRFRNTDNDVFVSPRAEDTKWSRIPLAPGEVAVTTRGGDVINNEDLMDQLGEVTRTDDLVDWTRNNYPEGSVTFEGIVDPGGDAHVPGHSNPSVVRATNDGENVRSAFARFDPRLRHLRNLNAGVGGVALGYGTLGGSDAQAAQPPEKDPGMGTQQQILKDINQIVESAPKRKPEPRLFSRDGQERRAWLDQTDDAISEAVRYYLGAGTGLPERIGTVAEMNPVQDGINSITASGRIMEPGATPTERITATGDMLSSLAGAALDVVPMGAVAKGGASLIDEAAPAARRIMAEEGGNMLLPKVLQPSDVAVPPAVKKLKKGAPRPEADPLGPFAPSSDPRYFGAAPDRSDISFLRYQPKKSTPRVAKALAALRDPNNPVRADMMDTIQRGISPEIRGQDWYNTEELRDWFVKELGEDAGHAEWSQFMDLMGAGSPMSNVPSNIKSASAMRNRLATDPAYREGLDAIQSLDEARVYGKQRPAGYGHQSQGLQELIHARQRQGAWDGAPEPGVTAAKGSMTDNPKPKGFTNSLKGNARNIAADLHFTRYMAMASKDPDFLSLQAGIGAKDEAALLARFPKAQPYIQTKEVKGKPVRTFNVKKAVKDGAVDFDGLAEFDIPALYAEKPNDAEYADFEIFMKEIGDQIGLTPAQTQAALWMGAGDKTGLAESSKGTFMDLFRRRVGERAGETGRGFDETLQDFIRNKGLLSLPAGGVGALLLSGPEDQKGGT